jgi:bifunctional DNase/RNase
VQRAVADLPRGQRAAVVLFYLLGLTHAETAAHLGIEVGAVKARLHKARGVLRRSLWELWEEQEMATPTEAPLIEMRIESVRKDADEDDPDNADHHVMVLEEVGGSRYLLIWIGFVEGLALANALQKTEMPRPLTIAFMANVLQATQTTLREVHVSKLVGDVFYATVFIDGPAGSVTMDARPSDALTLATILGAPIRVAREVLDTAGVTIEKKTVQDEHGREVIEQTARNVTTGEDVERVHLDPQTLASIRVLLRGWNKAHNTQWPEAPAE